MIKYNYNENEVNQFAKEISKSVVIRSYVNGSSNDDRRDSTQEEALLIERAISACLTAIKNGYDAASAKATAEFFVIHDSGKTHINTYDSVYMPIGEFLKEKATEVN